MRFCACVFGVSVALGCGRSSNDSGGETGANLGLGGAGDAASCQVGAALSGTTYDIAKSRYAFGSTPVRQDEAYLTRWVGSEGVMAIATCGKQMAGPNGGAPESGLPDWSSDSQALSAHVRDYFIAMGVDPCQIGATQIHGGTDGATVHLDRAIDQIPIVESNAYARFNVNDHSTFEGLYWPTIPAETVAAAFAFRDALGNAAARAAFKAKLPSNAQADGQIVIHHSTCGFSPAPPFRSAATYDLYVTNPGGKGRTLSFDQDGNEITVVW